LPPLPPLRTVLAPFDAYGSSIGQRTGSGTRSSALAFRTTCTLLRDSQQRNRRKPHQQERYTPPTFLHCFLKSVCSRFTYANTRGKSAGFRRGMMSPCGSTPIRSVTDRPSLTPSSRTRRPFGFSCESLSSTRSAGETTGLPRSAAVTVWVRSRLSAGGTRAVPEEFGASGLDHVPFGPSDSASCACPL